MDSRDIKKSSVVCSEAQYQTVSVKRKEEHFTSTSTAGVEEMLKRIVPAKSFLYRNQPKDKTTSYVPMDGTGRKHKRFFRLSSYEHLKQRFSRNENYNDQGYYSVKTNSRYYIQKTYKQPESRTKYKSLSTTDELKYADDHFYEDLCYNDVEQVNTANSDLTPPTHVKPCVNKLQELFQSFKLPFFKKTEVENKEVKEVVEKKTEDKRSEDSDNHIYENTDNPMNMYDSVHVVRPVTEFDGGKEKSKLAVEEYLEPIVASKDYCDVSYRQRNESLLGYIMSLFESFGIRRETSEANQTEESESGPHQTEVQRWPERVTKGANMADRPLPVPVENEPYYMNVDRGEAENLLKGQPDGTFILRPSSQPSHAYTLSVSCGGAVHNVGVRRRSDGRLALGYARRGERSFASVPSLLRHHRRRRLLLVSPGAPGGVLGATALTDSPHYYHTPKGIPVHIATQGHH